MSTRKNIKKILLYLILTLITLLIIEIILWLGGVFLFQIYNTEAKPVVAEDAFRILFLGESTTAGAGLDNPNDAYANQVEKLLQQKYPDKKIKSYKRGRGASEMSVILRHLNENMIEHKPQLVVLMAGRNDHFVPDEGNKLKIFLSSLRLYRILFLMEGNRLNCENILSPKEGNNLWQTCKIIASKEPSYNYKPSNTLSEVTSNFNKTIKIIHSYNSEIYLAGYLQPDAQKDINPFLKKIAEDNQIIYIDEPPVDFKQNSSFFASDGWHPSKEGHRIIAEKIVETIVNNGIIDRWQSA